MTALLLLLSAVALGVYAGAMLTEGFVLVPYWQSLPPPEFFAWYAANDARLVGFFGRVTEIAALLSVVAAIAAFVSGIPGRWAALGAALLIAVCVGMFFVYFAGANARFSAASIPPESLAAELRRWAAWHHTRTALVVVACVLALISLRLRA